MSVIFLSCAISIEAEAAIEMNQNNEAGSNSDILENGNATQANTTSKVAEDNDRKDVNNDSTNKSDFDKQADGSLSVHIQQMLSSNVQLSGKVANLKVIAVDGRVTLQGMVNSEEERASIVDQVENMAGVDNVDDQIKIESK